MFDAYFCPRVVRRLESNANATQLKAYVADLDHRGYTRLTIQSYVAWIERFIKWLHRRRQSLDLRLTRQILGQLFAAMS